MLFTECIGDVTGTHGGTGFLALETWITRITEVLLPRRSKVSMIKDLKELYAYRQMIFSLVKRSAWQI